MLKHAHVHATLPASDLARARKFWENSVGLTPVEESPAGVWYGAGDTRFLLFPSSGKPSGDHTQVGFSVDDIHATVDHLHTNGVHFEEYDMPGLKTEQHVASLPNGDKTAWFHDTEGNFIGVIQRANVPAATH